MRKEQEIERTTTWSNIFVVGEKTKTKEMDNKERKKEERKKERKNE